MARRFGRNGLAGMAAAMATAAAVAEAAAVAAARPALAQAPERPTLTVAGEGAVAVAPDVAVITLGVQEVAPTAGAAARESGRKAAGILRALAAAGVEADDIQTAQLSLAPRYGRPRDGREEPELVGFEARNLLRVRLRALDRVGAVLDAVVAAGANSVQGLSFRREDMTAAADEARARAVADALRRARVLAAAAGLEAGEILSIVEQGRSVPVAMDMMRLDSAATPVAPGELRVEASVSMVVALEAPDAGGDGNR